MTVETGRVVVLAYEQTPLLVNVAYRVHYHTRARHEQEWNEHFGALAEFEGVAPFEACMIEVRHTKGRGRTGRGKLPDTGACYPSVKAAIDGIVATGILADDGPAVLRGLMFQPPEWGDADRVELYIHELRRVEQETTP